MIEFNDEIMLPRDLKFEGRIRLGESIPVLPIRDSVLFPFSVLPLTIERESSLKLLEEVKQTRERYLGVVTQRDASKENPQEIDLFGIGTLAVASKEIRLKDRTRIVFVQGIKRIRINRFTQYSPFPKAEVELLDDIAVTQEAPKTEALRRNVESLFERVVSLSPGLPPDLVTIALNLEDLSLMADFMSSVLPSHSIQVKQEFLETLDVWGRLEKLNLELARLVKILELKNKIQSEVQDEVGKSQKEYYLREQLKAIHRELGDEDTVREIEELKKQIEAANLPEEAGNEALRELKRLSYMSPSFPEYSVIKTYLDWMVSLPWVKWASAEINLDHARKTLDRDHYGLEKIKERILEYLAILKLNPAGKSPILCFIGPPGVGKTSLGKSIADALGRKFVRISLGGMHDEAEIRGHRRTYIGALPGQIIQGIRRAGERNPVFMLDEVDKIGKDFRGDPAAALLEVLDPDQNFSFRDHYLDVPFDLSRVLFITTANILDTIPPPLQDRMEVVELYGYTEEEKLEIALRYLLQRQSKEAGVAVGEHLELPPEVIRQIIRHYTREAGLRNLEREISKICRKRARQLVSGVTDRINLTRDNLSEYLGVPRFLMEEEIEERVSFPGVAVGLAWTPAGGDILFVEASRMKGEKNVTITGQLGNVMQESVKTALTWVRSHAAELGVDEDFFAHSDLHVHVPEGAIPKDGPSAGVTMVTTLVSLLTGKPVRPKLAMTGEITLSGKVLPVGGIKEKVLAAHRLGIREVILPRENERNVTEDLPLMVREELCFHFVGQIHEVVEIALGIVLRKPVSKKAA